MGNESHELKENILRKHNEFRSLHKDTPELKWCNALAEGAQKWANHLGEIKKLQHADPKDRNNCGENIFFAGTSGEYNVKELSEKCCDKWYSEIENFDWDKKGKKSDDVVVGHFTQVVWKNSQKVGAGFVKVKDDNITKYFVVARYEPAGNYIGQEPDNVMELK